MLSNSIANINSNNYTIDPNQVEDKSRYHRSKNNPIKGIIEVDLRDIHVLVSLRQIADKYELHLVDENCHVLSA